MDDGCRRFRHARLSSIRDSHKKTLAEKPPALTLLGPKNGPLCYRKPVVERFGPLNGEHHILEISVAKPRQVFDTHAEETVCV